MSRIYAVKMREYDKHARCLARTWTAAKWGIRFEAGNSTANTRFVPSAVVEVTKEQYDYITGRRADGNPNVGQPRNHTTPMFTGWTFKTRRELSEMVQREADTRAAGGKNSARALMQLRGPLEPAEVQQEAIDFGGPATNKVEANPPVEVKEEPPVDSDNGFQPMDVEAELAKEETDQAMTAEPEPESEPEPEQVVKAETKPEATEKKKPGPKKKKPGPKKKSSHK